jgi:solute carrier family 25 phosphate transporter 3
MTLLFPHQAILKDVFGTSSPFASRRPIAPKPRSNLARLDLYSAFSATDDVKAKATQVGDAAAAKIEKASAKAQGAFGHIELFSAKYYAACTFGGLMACVSSNP